MAETAHPKILIVDDDPDVRRALFVRLTARHYDTFFAGDGLSAIAEAQKQQPDLILLDLGLPGEDGFAVMRTLQASPTLGGIPIIVVSARDVLANKYRALKAGAKAYLQKPVDDVELLAAVREVLKG